MDTLKDQVAIVTGGARGIGKSISLSLAEEKARIVIIDILSEEGEKKLSEVRGMGVDAEFFKVDIRERESVEKVFADSVHRFGRQCKLTTL